MPSFNAISRRCTINCKLRKNLNFASKVANWIIHSRYSQVSLLPASTSKQGNVIGLVSVYMSSKKM